MGKDFAFDKCPMNFLNDRECSEIYSLINNTLLAEMSGGLLPSHMLEELNIYFSYRDTISRAKSDFRKGKN